MSITQKYPKLFRIFLVLLLLGVLYLIFFVSSGPRIRKDISPEQEFPELEALQSDMDFKAISDFFKNIADEEGSQYAYYALISAANLGEIPDGIDTHLLGHEMSDLIYKDFGLDGIQICTHDLRNSCSHSIVIGAFLERGVDALKDISDVCRKAPGGIGAYNMCFHGLGHGVLSYTGYNLEETVELCAQAETSKDINNEYIECVGGAVMEMMSGVNDPVVWEEQSKNYFSQTDPLAPCSMDIIPHRVKPICYVYLTPHLLEHAGADLADPQVEHFRKVFQYCDAIPEDQLANRANCFGGLGKEFIVLAANSNVDAVEFMSDEQLETVYDWCLLTDDPIGQEDCIGNAMASLFWGGENDPGSAVSFCSLIDNQEHKDFCFFHLMHSADAYLVDVGVKESFCSLIPDPYRRDCL